MNYENAASFRRALTDRLKRQAQTEGTDLMRLQKQLVFERFLARLFQGEARWVLKGGYALELRLGQARGTQDLDLNIPPPPLSNLLGPLQAAANLKDALLTDVSRLCCLMMAVLELLSMLGDTLV